MNAMRVLFMAATFVAVQFSGLSASAQVICPTTAIANGNPADAILVTNWFLCKAPTDNPSFTGSLNIGSVTGSYAVSAAGTIYSSSGGFKFPDGTIQTTAATGGGSSPWTISGVNIYNSNTGNVGISTSAPGYPLTVNGTVASLTGGFRFPDGTTQTTAATGGGGFWTSTGINIYNNNTGNVGIGTSSPSAALQIGANSNTVPTGTGLYISNAKPLRFAAEVTGNADYGAYLKPALNGSSLPTLTFGGRLATVDTDIMTLVNTGAGTGNVGIGTANPSATLQIGTNSNTIPTSTGLYISNTKLLRFAAEATGNADYGAYLKPGLNGSSQPTLTFGGRLATVDTGIMTLVNTGGGTGSVGIGTAAPVKPLDVYKAINTSTIGSGEVLRVNGSNNNTVGNVTELGIGGAAGAAYSPTVIGSVISVATSYNTQALYFATRNATTDSAPTERMRITATGNVGIGTTSPSQALEVAGEVQVDTLASASSTNLCITSTSGGVIANCSSSIRYKENVRSASFGLGEIMAMRPVTFKWKGRAENDLGLIAEEVAKINPLFVTYKNGKIEGVKYPLLVAVLIGAIKKQQGEIHDLQVRVRELSNHPDIHNLIQNKDTQVVAGPN